MSTANRVPETRTMGGDQLSADDAWQTLRRNGSWKLVRDAFVRFRYADGFSHARALAFQSCLAALPFTVALLGLTATLHAQKLGDVLKNTLTKLTPGSSDTLLNSAFKGHSGSGGQLALWLGLAGGVVSLTTAMGQVERGANRIYGIERDRPSVKKYGHSVVMVLTVGLATMIGFLLIVAGSATGHSLAAAYHWSHSDRLAWDFTRWPLGIALALISATVVFSRAPNRRQPGGTWLAIGAMTSLVLWLVFTVLLALYVAKSSTFGSTYGALTGVLALLIWANLSALALFLGVAFSAQLEAVRAGSPEPVDEREPKVAAPSVATATSA
jgi:YihY family inner membrane protein